MFTLILEDEYGNEALVVNAIEEDLDQWYAFAERYGFYVVIE